MEKNLTINYTYYNPKTFLNLSNTNRLLRKLVREYKNNYDCYFQIIDDASPVPINLKKIPSHWSVYKINEDIGWNNEGARNVLMETSKTEWNFLVDMDYMLTEENIKRLIDIIPKLNENKAYKLSASPHKQSINNILITKKVFNEIGGYDKAFLGMYGNDVTVLAKLKKIETLYDVKLKRIDYNVIHDNQKSAQLLKFLDYIKGLERAKLVHLSHNNGFIRIDWLDESKHKHYYKHFTWSKLQ